MSRKVDKLINESQGVLIKTRQEQLEEAIQALTQSRTAIMISLEQHAAAEHVVWELLKKLLPKETEALERKAEACQEQVQAESN